MYELNFKNFSQLFFLEALKVGIILTRFMKFSLILLKKDLMKNETFLIIAQILGKFDRLRRIDFCNDI